MAITRDALIAFLERNFGLRSGELQDDTPIFSQGLLDSFSLVELVGYIEGEAGFKMGMMDVNLENLDTIDRILRYVARKS